MIVSSVVQPVYIVPSNELAQNGGPFQIAGGAAIPLVNQDPSELISTEAGNQLETGSDGKLYVPSAVNYLLYVADIRQLSTDAPAEVQSFANTLGTLVWSRQNTGQYQFVLPNSYTDAFVLTQIKQGAGYISVVRLFGSTYALDFRDFAGAGLDGGRWYMEVRVYL